MYELFWFKKGSYLDIRIMQEMAMESDLDGRWCVCFRYWHRSLNPRKLIEVKFSHLSRNMTMQRTLKLYKLPDVGFCAVAATSFFFFCLSDPTSLAQFLLLKHVIWHEREPEGVGVRVAWLAECQTKKPGTLWMWAWFPGVARDFFKGSASSADPRSHGVCAVPQCNHMHQHLC